MKNNMNELTPVFLSQEEAEMFLSFREHQSEFMILKANGIFSTKNGSITCHFDDKGIVRKIETNFILFKA